MGVMRMYDNAMKAAQQEHYDRMAVIRRNAEAMKKGYVLEHGEISRRLMHAKIEAITQARAGGYLQEVLSEGVLPRTEGSQEGTGPGGNGKQVNQEEGHGEHAQREPAEGEQDDRPSRQEQGQEVLSPLI